jgi:hypothetical protein
MKRSTSGSPGKSPHFRQKYMNFILQKKYLSFKNNFNFTEKRVSSYKNPHSESLKIA